MIYAQFYSMSTGYVPNTIPPVFDEARKQPIEACGDRAIIFIDARLKSETIGEIARAECVKRGFVGYRIFKGERLDNAAPISGYWPAPHKPETVNAHLRAMGM